MKETPEFRATILQGMLAIKMESLFEEPHFQEILALTAVDPTVDLPVRLMAIPGLTQEEQEYLDLLHRLRQVRQEVN